MKPRLGRRAKKSGTFAIGDVSVWMKPEPSRSLGLTTHLIRRLPRDNREQRQHDLERDQPDQR
jgi:hypothetical protein